ncbi:DUF2982 domain-containing protein [Vibrio sp. IRLE0018]|uniref:DUF2982 domain-containing protein n=1 Tax=Vibrio TaxID=662 RepID=UPI001592D607|nr:MULTISPECIES: DUF2982 domain-containing protein [Vibrio]MCF8778981.1 DUF2982 domain-containing protein [Vibrio floridensis]NVC61876.1 DUF2982 domain-containing protein [Vibrio sp. 05-20-BW147]HAS6347630.1 DUF2982 domain-containing protein [Vibrio vulnificus]HAS6350557.1 DUF2982 domain-containing protein [Vibrio vulnificus]
MQTLQLSNSYLTTNSAFVKGLWVIFVFVAVLLLILSPGWQQALLSLGLIITIALFALYLIKRSTVAYTLTSTHFQQHLFRGGWVVKWRNVERIGICTYESEGWHQPLPWIGIKLQRYSPYLNAVCPRVATEVLLSQRALLYLGARQHQCESRFEEMVLDATPFIDEEGREHTGLQAMLANRMRYQRVFFDYDIFISAQDLDRPAEEFVGLTRRYLAAAEPDQP